jgi:Arc/MetJ-type ribon-helix-helix transcriptional regulator
MRRHNVRSGKALNDPNDRFLAGRDPVVAVRLPDETITEVDRLARTLGLSSRSEAIRYMIIRSAASIELPEIKGRRGPGPPREIHSIERKCFLIDVFKREQGKWRALIRHSDGSKIRVGNVHLDLFTTSVDTSTADQLHLARKAINEGAVE